MKSDVYTTKSLNLDMPNLYEGIVTEIINPDNGTLRVKIEELDREGEIPICYATHSYTFLRVLPLVGERVTVMLRRRQVSDLTYDKGYRYWMGLIHSSPLTNIFEDFRSADFKENGYNQNIASDKQYLPKNDEIVLFGRNNSWLRLPTNAAFLGAGVIKKNEVNVENPAYLYLSNTGKESTAVLTAEKLVLLASGNKTGNVNGISGIPTDAQLLELLDGDKMVYGEKLVEVLRQIREVLLGHVHPYHAMKPVSDFAAQQLQNLDLEQILNKNIIVK